MFAAGVAVLAGDAFADTRYTVAPERAKANRAKVEAFAEKACWKDAPLAACAVEATSGIRRTPDLFPEDGDFTGPVRAVLAKGEYEDASFLLYGFEDVEDVSVAVDVPGIEADVTVVKVWYLDVRRDRPPRQGSQDRWRGLDGCVRMHAERFERYREVNQP